MGNEVKEFYDDYVPHQRSVGINIRHHSIINRLKRAGLNASSNVLEIGCGIGTLTTLLAKVVTSGKIVSYDISDESVKFARKLLAGHKNIEFIVADIVDHQDARKFDVIVLADVLEHVPVETHARVFQKLTSMMNAGSTLAINIPFPHYLAWVTQHMPGELQVIDQVLHTDALLTAAYPAGLYLHRLETYSLWMRPADYQWIEFRRNEGMQQYTKKSKLEVMKRSIGVRMGRS